MSASDCTAPRSLSRWRRWREDWAVLRALLRGMPHAGEHAERLAAFYAPQIAHYDRFRERLLRGRRELLDELALPLQAHIVELGGGTGQVCEMLGERLNVVRRYDVVDVCAPMIEQARARAQRIPALQPVLADACTWQPEHPVDMVIASYSLTMMPDWRATIDNAWRMLKPGGYIAVVDFHVSSAQPDSGQVRHGAWTRRFWPRWFARDGVRVGSELLPALRQRFIDHTLVDTWAPVPYLPGLRVPYFRFVGRRP